jgi:pimeloyl-ACP methyl ester carboxylesterase
MSVIARQYTALRDWHCGTKRLAALRMPVLLLAGGKDWVCPPDESRRIAASLPDARLELMPEGGHWMMHQQPGKLATLVDAFLMTQTRLTD